ncbi:MAG: hypothetical protein R3B59_09310 [Dehalococcoidia bacterium]
MDEAPRAGVVRRGGEHGESDEGGDLLGGEGRAVESADGAAGADGILDIHVLPPSGRGVGSEEVAGRGAERGGVAVEVGGGVHIERE